MPIYGYQRLLGRAILLSVLLSIGIGAASVYGANHKALTNPAPEAFSGSVASNTDDTSLTLKPLAVHYLSATQLAQQLAPFVPAPGSIAAVNHQLVINSSASNIAEIEALLQRLDTPPEELILSVRFDAPREFIAQDTITNSRHYQTRASSHPAPQVRTQTHQPTRIARSRTRDELIPSGWGGFNSQKRSDKGYELYATVVLQGKQANIALATRHYQGDAIDQDLYDIETRVSGPIGQWLALTPAEQQSNPASAKHYQIAPSTDTVYIKVERLADISTDRQQ